MSVILLILLSMWACIGIASQVHEGETQTFDDWVIHAFRSSADPSRSIGPSWLQSTALNITSLGSVAVLLIVTLIVVGYLWLEDRYREMWLVIVATIGGQLISTVLKATIARPRPDAVLHLTPVYTASFPSGHSMLSAVIYLTLGALLAAIEPRWTLRIYWIVVALFLSFIIGVSRVYLGVHYPTDVLAGWSVGLAWALLCWLVAHLLSARHRRTADARGFGPQVRM